MAEVKRSTVYFEPQVHRALKVKAAVTDQSISALVNDAVREALREDAADIATARRRLRSKEKGIPYNQFVRQLKKDGLL